MVISEQCCSATVSGNAFLANREKKHPECNKTDAAFPLKLGHPCVIHSIVRHTLAPLVLSLPNALTYQVIPLPYFYTCTIGSRSLNHYAIIYAIHLLMSDNQSDTC